MKSILLLVTALLAVSSAQARNAEQVESGVVLTIERSLPTPGQEDDGRYREEVSQSHRSRTGKIVGALIGGALASAAARHSEYRYEAAALGGAIGGAIGANRDRHNAYRRAEAATNRKIGYAFGAQVVVRKSGGKVVAIYSNHAERLHPGQQVWIVGEDQVIPRQ